MIELLPILLLGFIFGFRHALEPDHIVAMVNILTKTKSFKKALSHGTAWGIGHTLTLLVVGTAILFFSLSIPRDVTLLFEAIVGLMIIVLGASVLFEIWKGKIHIHMHAHDDIKHAHFHTHENAKNHIHQHDNSALSRPLIIGTIHGLAGSAALMLLVLSTIKSAFTGILYILVFGAGTVLSMAIISCIVSFPFIFTGKVYKNLHVWLNIGSGLGSILFGLLYIARLLI